MINDIIGIHVDIDAIYVIRQIILFYDVLDKVKIDLLREKSLKSLCEFKGICLKISVNLFSLSISLSTFLMMSILFCTWFISHTSANYLRVYLLHFPASNRYT